MTLGRKHRRLDDIDVVAADHHDSEQMAQVLHAAINVVTQAAAVADETTALLTASSSVCDRWYHDHVCCIHLATVLNQYVCSQCS